MARVKKQKPRKTTRHAKKVRRKPAPTKKRVSKKTPRKNKRTAKKRPVRRTGRRRAVARKKTTRPAPRRRRIRPEASIEAPAALHGLGPDSAGQSGDNQGLPEAEIADSESVDELAEEGQAFEAELIDAVENAPEGEVRTREVPEDDVPEEYLDKD